MSRAHRGAYEKGRKAAEEGRSTDDCPYSYHTLGSRGFRRAWLQGYKAAYTASVIGSSRGDPA